MPLQLTEREAAAFFAQIKRPMPANAAVAPRTDPIPPVVGPARARKAKPLVRTAKRPETRSAPATSPAMTFPVVGPQFWLALLVLGLIVKAILETPTF